jgi:TetR/AcrR family fatty acid metabolism transcriptional regulator
MTITKSRQKEKRMNSSNPPGRIKIANALRELLKTKDFGSITTSDISSEAGVNESLIYRYFGDKRGLLHGVLSEHLEIFVQMIDSDLKGINGVIDKLRRLIWSTINFYDQNRVFAKILLLEVRSHQGYFESKTYQLVKGYTHLVIDIIQEGIDTGEIRDDITPKYTRQIILGSIEHLIIAAIIHNGPIDVDLLQEELCNTIFKGIAKTKL